MRGRSPQHWSVYTCAWHLAELWRRGLGQGDKAAGSDDVNMPSSTHKKVLLQEQSKDKTRCLVCERRCLLVEGGRGWCQTKINREGTIYTLIYGAISSLSANPIEKKPFYHFFPGSKALTAGSWSCNFGCPWCQNWDISKTLPPESSRFMTPGDFIKETQRRECQGTSISFNEPTLSLEWSLDVFRLAQSIGLYNTFVTNGYMTADALDLLVEAGLTAMNVDIKGSSVGVRKYCKGINVEKVWERCQQARALGLHLEITSLIIPGFNDADDDLKDIANRIVEELGSHTPWHVSGYMPAYRFIVPPTPTSTLEGAYEIGKETGLKYVYIGNVIGHPYDNTYCPQCGTILIKRLGFDLVQNAMANGLCPQCGMAIDGVGWNWQMENQKDDHRARH
jgi:pyruvate formate lyase activating enzyme